MTSGVGGGDGAEDLVNRVIDVLTGEHDARVRWQAIVLLNSRLEWLRALTVRQVLLDGLSQRAAAAALGVSRGRVNQLAGRAAVDDAAHAWGQALAIAGALAVLAERPGTTRFSEEGARLVATGLRTPAVWADLEDAVPGWLAAAHRRGRGDEADALVGRLAERLAAAVDLPDGLTVEQRGEVAIGFHGEHERREHERRERED